MSERELLRRTADHAADFFETLETRPVRPEALSAGDVRPELATATPAA